MSQWCSTCHLNEYQSCNKDCIVFGKDFEKLAEMVIKQKEEIDALRWANKQIIKFEKKKRKEIFDKMNQTK